MTPFDPFRTVEFKEIAINKFKQQIEMKIDANLFRRLDFAFEERMREIAIYIQSSFWGERIIKEITVEFNYKKPKSVWQHFKQEYFPKFLLKKFPVKEETIKVTKIIKLERDIIFPDVYADHQKVFGRIIIRDLHATHFK